MEMEEITVEAEKTGGASESKEDKTEETETYSKLQSPTEDLYAEAKFLPDPSKTKTGGVLGLQGVRLWRVVSLFLGLICLVLVLVIVLLVIKHNNAPSVAICKEPSPRSVIHIPATADFHKLDSQSDECPRFWVQHGESCFFLSTFRLTWDEAKRNCSSLGGDLAVITSRSVQNFLTQGRRVQYWIGLRRDGTWTWVDMSPMTLSYWSDFHPRGNCAMLDAKLPSDKNWIESSCTRPTYYICERAVSTG